MGKMTNMSSTSPLNQGSGFVIGIHMRGDGVFGFGTLKAASQNLKSQISVTKFEIFGRN